MEGGYNIYHDKYSLRAAPVQKLYGGSLHEAKKNNGHIDEVIVNPMIKMEREMQYRKELGRNHNLDD